MESAPALITFGDASSATRIAARRGAGATGLVVQHQEFTFKRLFIDVPVVIFVESGTKALRWSGGEYIIRAGEAVAVANGHPLDITNRVAYRGEYRARWLACDDALVAAHASAHPQCPVIRSALPLSHASADLGDAFKRAAQALADDALPDGIVRHRVTELLLWVGLAGGRFEQVQDLTMSLRVRRLLVQDLARSWSAVEVASAFAISEPTLRRRLADEDTSLTGILVDARMSLALQLIQSTAQPVTQIALAVGYQTSSQFAVRFRERFGFSPTAIRGHRRTGSPAPI